MLYIWNTTAEKLENIRYPECELRGVTACPISLLVPSSFFQGLFCYKNRLIFLYFFKCHIPLLWCLLQAEGLLSSFYSFRNRFNWPWEFHHTAFINAGLHVPELHTPTTVSDVAVSSHCEGELIITQISPLCVRRWFVTSHKQAHVHEVTFLINTDLLEG